jgi:DNA-binding PadR family transcriptional regulator
VPALIGVNEALILASLTAGEGTIAQIAERLEKGLDPHEIGDGTIYVALQRMIARGFVTRRKDILVAADGRPREVGHYRITDAGSAAMSAFERKAAAVPIVRLSPAGA